MTTTTAEQITALGRTWAAAELNGDAETLAAISADDFAFVGPAGFVLHREQWVHRYDTGVLRTKSLDWTDVEVRDYGDTAVAVGVHTQQADHGENSADGTFRITHIAVRRGADWKLAGIHMSPMMAGRK